MQGADIQSGHLTAAYLRGAYLQGADLFSAKMYGATLTSAKVQGARLSWTYLQGATLNNSNLQGAGNHEWDSATPFSDRIQRSIGKESDLSKVVDTEIMREGVKQIVDELSSPEKRHALEQQLRPYINRPYRLGLSENHGAVIGSYTKEDAEEWITEHEAAMREPKPTREDA